MGFLYGQMALGFDFFPLGGAMWRSGSTSGRFFGMGRPKGWVSLEPKHAVALHMDCLATYIQPLSKAHEADLIT